MATSLQRVVMRWRVVKLGPCLQPFASHQMSTDTNNKSVRSPDDTLNTSGPLQGIRVLDLSRVLAGPFCTMLLGDLGAEIIKIEQPGIGDDTRRWGPPWVGSESGYFLSVNRNKKSVTVNLKKKDGIHIIEELAKTSDVLVENYLPGKLSQMGLGYEQLSILNPRLIYASITGFGSSGPYANRGGYDSIAAAVGGLLHITGPKDGEPCRVGVAMTDISTGLFCKSAILAALLRRHRTDRGQHVECNLLNTQVAVLTHIASGWLNCGVEAERLGTSHPSLVPYQAFETQKKGEYILIGAGNNTQFGELCQRLGLEYLQKDDAYCDNGARVTNRKKLTDVLCDRLREKTIAEWMEVFQGVAFPYGPINNISQVFNDPQVLHNKIVHEMEHSTAGTIRVPGPPVQYSESKPKIQCAPPTLGQDTANVLREILHYDDRRIEQLRESSVI